ncbi:hypothetical protein MNBD_ALPHA01-814 [hydrothermal vent metagenome]|uniref:INTEGRAL MEMBRANE PROTEIN (Rhomboid family) n=1 Tax=hydrothermal vent metagenome TaxID=652676 RepID=A0A3B0RPK9_9ZZZZ
MVMKSITGILAMTTGIMSKVQICQLAVLARVVMAAIFWKSAMTKITFDGAGLAEFSLAQIWNVITLNWAVADSAYMLFEYEYDLPLIPFALAAHMAVAAEILLPMALIVGLFTRYAALLMLVMTLVIQIFVYPGLWTVHGLWAIALLTVMAKGGGRMSVDHLIGKKYL